MTLRKPILMIISIHLLIAILVVLLSGCWDLKNPQDVNYFTAVGFDYEDGRYVVYTQMIDFAAISTRNNTKQMEEIPTWVGRGVGDTASSAFNDLYDTIQLRGFYGHVNAIIFSERIMEHGLDNVFDLISRYNELRYTPWVFGSSEDMNQLLSATTFFNQSPISSFLHQPQELYKQKSIVKPLMLREFIFNIREPGQTALIPALTLDDSEWKVKEKVIPLLAIEGAYAFHSSKLKDKLLISQLMGLRWTNPDTNRSPLIVRHQEKIYAEVSLERPKVQIKAYVQDDKMKFKMNVSLKGEIIEVIEDLPELELERYAAEHVKEEIIASYEKALENQIDLYGLEHILYRQHPKVWRRVGGIERDLNLQLESLEVEVTVNLLSAGKLKQ